MIETIQEQLEQQKCVLLSGLSSYVVQFLLGIIALSTLWYKRTVERPKRSFEVWVLDVSKQGIGAVVGHIANLVIAIILPATTDECVWYFLNFVADVGLGTIISIAFLHLQQEMAIAFEWTAIQETGEYGNPISYKVWSLQLLAWLVIIFFSKLIVTSVLIAWEFQLATFGNLLFSPLENHPFEELVLVMIICPCFLNIVQFWIQDTFLKRANPFSLFLNRNPNKNKTTSTGFDQTLQVSLLSSDASVEHAI